MIFKSPFLSHFATLAIFLSYESVPRMLSKSFGFFELKGFRLELLSPHLDP